MKVPSNYKNVSLQTHHLMRSKPVPAIFALEGEYDETMFTRNHKMYDQINQASVVSDQNT